MAGTLTISTLSDGTNSTSATNCIQGSAKAWANWNGVSGASIRASFNVSSITRTATGRYTVNFTNAMPDANYAVAGSGDLKTGSYRSMMQTINAGFSTTSIQLNFNNDGNGADVDTERACVTIFR